MSIKNLAKHYDRIIEISTWIIIVGVIFGVRFLPQNLIDDGTVYYLIGGIISFVLLYYFVIYKYFSKENRVYIKNIADIVLIGVLIHIVKDYNQYFFALYFLPIAAAALSLEFINALLIATIASLFVVFEIFLGSQDLLPHSTDLYQGLWQIILILTITIFCRFLAIQLREEKRQKEEQFEKNKLLLEQAKVEKEFLSLTSHQLYTPVSIIRGFASMLDSKDMGELSPKQKEAVKEIYTSSVRLTDLVSELLDVTRIERPNYKLKKEEVNLNELIESTVDQLSQIKGNSNVHIINRVENKLPKIFGEKEKIRQVLYNLLSNAIKYTKFGEIVISAKIKERSVEISFKDQGAGINRQDLPKLFQPFFRGENILELDNKGTGLGLYISKLIIEKHGGHIWADSKLNEGSIFTFSLPVGKRAKEIS